MSKKKAVYLKIEDWDDFIWHLQALKKELIPDELRKHEVDVIGFEAEIDEPLKFRGQDRTYLHIGLIVTNNKKFSGIKHRDKVQVFILKPKKPEGKHEKDVSHP